MGQVVVVRFSVLAEAQVARAALHSAGIPALVADEHYGSLDWELHTGLQGFRLMVPVEDFDDASQILLAARRLGAADILADPGDIPVRPRTLGWIIAGLFPGVFMPEWGFFIEAVRRRPQVFPVALACAAAGMILTVMLQVLIALLAIAH